MEEELARLVASGRVLVVGIGNRRRGDDGAGPALIDRLTGRVSVALLDCGEVPERYLGKMMEVQPDRIVLVDAVETGQPAGSVVLMPAEDLKEAGYSTHQVSLRVMAEFLTQETGAEVWLLGMQPLQREWDAPMSEVLDQSVEALAVLLMRIADLR